MARQTDSNAGRTQVAQLLASGGSWAQLFRASRTHYNQRSLLANSPAWGVRLPGPRPFTTHAFTSSSKPVCSIYTPPESGKRRTSHVSLPLLSHPFNHAIYSPVSCSLLAPSAAFPTPKRFRVAYMKPTPSRSAA